MEYKNKLLVQNKKWIVKQDWYLQRFDACPNYLHALVDAELNSEKRKGKYGHFDSHIAHFNNYKVDWYLNLNEMRKTGNWLMKKIKANAAFVKNIIKKWKKDEKNFQNYFEKNKFNDFSSYPNGKLLIEYEKAIKLYKKCGSSTSLIDGFVFTFDEYGNEHLSNIAGRDLALLGTPSKKSFISHEEENLKKIAKDIVKRKIGKKNFLKDPHILKLIKRHQQKFFWLKNNYTNAAVLDEEFFTNRIADSLQKDRKTKNRKANKITAFNKLRISKADKNLINSLPYWASWQDNRKMYSLGNV